MLETKIEHANKINKLKEEYKKRRKDFLVFQISFYVLVCISAILLAVGYSLSTKEKLSPVMWLSLIFVIPTFVLGVLGAVYIYLKIYPIILTHRIVVEEKKHWKEMARRYYSKKTIEKWLAEYEYKGDDEDTTIVE